MQRVARASVRVGASTLAHIGPGLCVLVGVAADDDEEVAARLARRLFHLRILPDASGGGRAAGAMERSVAEAGGQVLVVSQFTLYGDTSRGRRPSWSQAAPAEVARPLVEAFARHLAGLGAEVATGAFGEHMMVELVNDGPVTLMLEERRRPDVAGAG